jgi:hypothetical protein
MLARDRPPLPRKRGPLPPLASSRGTKLPPIRATSLYLQAFCVLRLMPRGDDPPSTPRRWSSQPIACLAGGVMVLALAVATCTDGRHASTAVEGRVPVRSTLCVLRSTSRRSVLLPPSVLRSAFCVDSQGGRPPFDPPPVVVTTDRGLGRGCGNQLVARLPRSTVNRQRSTVNGSSAFLCPPPPSSAFLRLPPPSSLRTARRPSVPLMSGAAADRGRSPRQRSPV